MKKHKQDGSINIRTYPELRERLDQIAAREGNHISAVCRRLLTKAVEAEDGRPMPTPRPRRRP